MEGLLIIGAAIIVAVSLGAIYDRHIRRRGAQVNTTPDRRPGGPYDHSPAL
jgi:hypothetical protein